MFFENLIDSYTYYSVVYLFFQRISVAHWNCVVIDHFMISNCTVLFFWLFLVKRKGDTMKGLLNVLAIQQLEGGTYTVDTILKVIKQITDWALAVGISLAGVALVVSFIMYAVVDVDQKPRVKTRITQTLLGIFGIILAISLVNIIIRLFT